jgi:oligopeptide/dipeptide ABC transporter ATP-binding protein
MSLVLRGLTVSYGHGSEALTAVDGIDLQVPPGGTLGLVGESGCGKSTVAKAIVGLVPIVSGQVLLKDVDYSKDRMRNAPEFRRRVQMIFQDPFSSLNPRMMVDEALVTRGLRSRSDRQKEAVHIFDMVGLSAAALLRYPHQFSGGQRQRIAIARALAVGPEVIVNDEVTSALDVSVQATILNLLKDLQRELKLSYLFISHDLSAVRAMSDVVSVMYLGRIVETAKTDELFAAPEHPYTKALIASVPQMGAPRGKVPLSGDLPDPRHPPMGCRFHTRCPIGPTAFAGRAICIEADPQTLTAGRRHESACHFAAETLTSDASALLASDPALSRR